MSLGTNVIAEARKMPWPESDRDISAKQSVSPNIQLVSSASNQLQAMIEVLDRDKFSLLINQLTVSRKSPSLEKQDAQWLRRQSTVITKKVTYLLEDFSLTEIDEKNAVAQMRSSPPHRQTSEVFYYEILLYGDRLVFNRYRKGKGAKAREKVASHLSYEVLQRLIDDLAEVLNGEESDINAT